MKLETHLYIMLSTFVVSCLFVFVPGCEPTQSAAIKQAQLVKVTVREVLMGTKNNGTEHVLIYIVQDGTTSKTAQVSEKIAYVPVTGDEVMVSGWGGGIWGDACIESVVTKTKAEVDFP